MNFEFEVKWKVGRIGLNKLMEKDTLETTKDEIRRSDPTLEDGGNLAFETAVVLLSAGFAVGPDIDLLAAFPLLPSFVADISRRMHESELWANGGV